VWKGGGSNSKVSDQDLDAPERVAYGNFNNNWATVLGGRLYTAVLLENMECTSEANVHLNT
jgi:hypothetical protein